MNGWGMRINGKEPGSWAEAGRSRDGKSVSVRVREYPTNPHEALLTVDQARRLRRALSIAIHEMERAALSPPPPTETIPGASSTASDATPSAAPGERNTP